MKLDSNVILVTGGGSGIGRGLAEAFHAHGNQVIVAGRRRASLEAVTAANPGMEAIVLDVANPASIDAASRRLAADFPALNVLVNNAGVQWMDRADGPIDEAVLTTTIATNLLGPIRLTAALLDQLKAQPRATIVHVSSMLALLPLASASLYCATKAALHSYALSQRYALRGTKVELIEILPPAVQTDLHRGSDPAGALPLDAYIEEVMALLATGAPEIVVASARSRLAGSDAVSPAAVEAFNRRLAATATS